MESCLKYSDKYMTEEMKYFACISAEEFIEVPASHPDIEQIISIINDSEIISLKVINTIKGLSYEGQYLTGKKLAVEIKIKQKILYVADKKTHSVHVLENTLYNFAYIVIPCLIEGTDPVFLVKNKMLGCKIDIEDDLVKKVNKRRVYVNISLLIRTVMFPVKEIAFSAHKDCDDTSVFVMHRNGSHPVKLTTCDEFKHYKAVKHCKTNKHYKPVWSPLGREIAFKSDDGFNKILNIYSLKSCGVLKLTAVSEFRDIGSFCWSGDSLAIYFSARDKHGSEIYSINTDNSGLRQITYGNGMYKTHRPECSPCGDSVAFLRTVSGLTDLWKACPDGMECVKLTSCGKVKDFDWSPDGRNIAYISDENIKPDKIYIIDLKEMETRKVYIDKSIPCKKKIKYSAHGRSFAFIGAELDSSDIYTYDLNAGCLTNITENCENTDICDFVWSADADCIYYAANELSYYCIYEIILESKQKRQLTNSMATKIDLDYRPRMC